MNDFLPDNCDYLTRSMWACGVFNDVSNGSVDRLNKFVASFVCPSIRHAHPELTFDRGDPSNEPGSIMQVFKGHR